jgi:hypothetical protein
MGISIKEKNDKYRIYNTNISKYITDFLSREDAMKFLKDRAIRQAKQRIETDLKDFPDGWVKRL